MKRIFISLLITCQSLLIGQVLLAQTSLNTDVLVIGGGTAGTAAGIQSARSGVQTIIVEPGPWLGGMLSAAAVSATDGNHNMPSGIWGEFRQAIYKRYGGADRVATGWVSNTHFEPRVADSILRAIVAATPLLSVKHGYAFVSPIMKGGRVAGASFRKIAGGGTLRINARVVIDATELGDVFAKAGAAYDLGMVATRITGEKVNVPESSDIIQDMTYAAILKDYGRDADCTIVRPSGYDPMEFDGCCRDFCSKPEKLTTNVSKQQMLDYAKLPNGKYLINWPGKGNDIYINTVEMDETGRAEAHAKARAKTMRFIYFLQTEMGFRHLGLANDEFPTADRLPLMPYHREGRRLRGLARIDLNHIATPFGIADPLYRTGIALIAAEKCISVSNVANGTTRLQPVVLLTGQAAGMLAAMSVKMKRQPRAVPVREVQRGLLDARAYLMPYFDIKPEHPFFQDIQAVGATGILKGVGEPFQWANRTWFYPTQRVRVSEVTDGLKAYGVAMPTTSDSLLRSAEAFAVAAALGGKDPGAAGRGAAWTSLGLGTYDPAAYIERAAFARILNALADPFGRFPVDHRGRIIRK
ncbi:MAG: FAD-dependent oxidoreductase [Chitinophagaceae bacterium]|nr:FAD-dependent oxidoreductase [Chitinophagaceae bacterium]